jgi:hypothetical protein
MKTGLLAVALSALVPLQVLAAEPQTAAPPTAVEPQEKENALTYLQAASAAFNPYAYVEKEGKFEPPTGEAAQRVVEENAAVFPLLEQAVAQPLNFDARTLNSDDVQTKLLSDGRSAARLIALRCLVQTEAGDAAGASRSGLLCVALGLKFQEDGGLLSALTGGGIEQIGLGAMEQLAPKWDADTLGVAARELGKIEAKRPPYALTLASENKSQVNFWWKAF